MLKSEQKMMGMRKKCMKSSQKALIIILFLTVSTNMYTMRFSPKIRKVTSNISRWLLGKDNTFPFMELPEEIQSYIIELMARYSDAQSLSIASKALLALSQTSSTFYTLINNTHFNEQLLSHLAERFACSPEKAALALSTPAAQKYLDKYYIISDNARNITLFLQSCTNINAPLDDQQNTALMIAVHHCAFKSIGALLKNKNINLSAKNDHDDNIFHIAFYTLSLLKAQGNTEKYEQLKKTTIYLLKLCKNDSQQAELIWAPNKAGDSPWNILESLEDDEFARQLYKVMGMV